MIIRTHTWIPHADRPQMQRTSGSTIRSSLPGVSPTSTSPKQHGSGRDSPLVLAHEAGRTPLRSLPSPGGRLVAMFTGRSTDATASSTAAATKAIPTTMVRTTRGDQVPAYTIAIDTITSSARLVAAASARRSRGSMSRKNLTTARPGTKKTKDRPMRLQGMGASKKAARHAPAPQMMTRVNQATVSTRPRGDEVIRDP